MTNFKSHNWEGLLKQVLQKISTTQAREIKILREVKVYKKFEDVILQDLSNYVDTYPH